MLLFASHGLENIKSVLHLTCDKNQIQGAFQLHSEFALVFPAVFSGSLYLFHLLAVSDCLLLPVPNTSLSFSQCLFLPSTGLLHCPI